MITNQEEPASLLQAVGGAQSEWEETADRLTTSSRSPRLHPGLGIWLLCDHYFSKHYINTG